MLRDISDIGIDFKSFFSQYQARNITSPSTFTDRILARLRGEQNTTGAMLPWDKTRTLVRFRAGEVTIWAGVNGHGKSMVLSQVILWMVANNHKAAIASLEMPSDTTGARLARQAAGHEHPSEEFTRKLLTYLDNKLWIYDQLGNVDQQTMLGVITYCATELGVTQFVIDSLMKCGIHADDFRNQKDFVDSLTTLAKDHQIHIHLVAHARKGQDEKQRINKFDIKGASEISDLADNVILVWRNKDKERRREASAKNPAIKWDEMEPDTLLVVDKQRHGEWEGQINLWFHQESKQYLPKPSVSAMPWPDPRNRFSVYEGGIQH